MTAQRAAPAGSGDPRPPQEQSRAIIHQLLNEAATPEQVAQLTQEALTCEDAVRDWLVALRLEAIRTLREGGMSLSQLGVLMNVSKSRAQQLVDLANKPAEAPATGFSRRAAPAADLVVTDRKTGNKVAAVAQSKTPAPAQPAKTSRKAPTETRNRAAAAVR